MVGVEKKAIGVVSFKDPVCYRCNGGLRGFIWRVGCCCRCLAVLVVEVL